MARKKTVLLKVYVTRIGIKDWVVAAPNQKAALRAWDVRENLFASGAAKEVRDPAAIVAALKTPGVPVAAPGQGAVKIPSTVVELAQHRRAPAKAPEPSPKKRDRSKLDAAELALALHAKEAKRKRADLERRRRVFEDELAAEEEGLERSRRTLEAKLEKARRSYEDS
ncbi:MAG: hypothetical protein WDM79_16970 [Terricaulis sp.]